MHMPILKRIIRLNFFLVFLLIGFTTSAMADSISFANVYLDQVVSFNPQKAGSARSGNFEKGMIGSDHMPLLNDFALGAPTGTGSWSSSCENDGLMVGVNGSATFRFQKGYYIFNGQGDDFRTWGDRFCWGGTVDAHCNELAHIQVSADNESWYYNGAESYDINPNPTQGNNGYQYHNTKGLHGNTPNWANHTKDMQAQHEVDGTWTNIPGTVVPKDFNAKTPYLGGDGFDLSDYLSLKDDSPWQDDMKMIYIRMIDDDTILDGQDYSPAWETGAIMQAAMGINVMKSSPVPLPGAVWLLGSGLFGVVGIRRKK
jgi:hypothetical protein